MKMSDKPYVVLLPGFLCDEAIWQPQVEFLSRDFHVITPVLGDQQTFRGMALAVIDFINAALPRRGEAFALVAHSLGAKVALEIMHLVPERIDRLVLMSTSVTPVDPDESAQRQMLIDLEAAQGMPALAEHIIAVMMHPDASSNVVIEAEVRQMLLRNTHKHLRSQISASLDRSDIAAYLPDIRIPVLLMCGDQDRWASVEQHEEMRDLLAEARLVVLPEAGHMLTLEKPFEVNRLLLEYLQD